MTFTIFTGMGNDLSLSQAFATLQYFNFIQQPLVFFPRIFSTLANIFNATRECRSPTLLADDDQIPLSRRLMQSRSLAGFLYRAFFVDGMPIDGSATDITGGRKAIRYRYNSSSSLRRSCES